MQFIDFLGGEVRDHVRVTEKPVHASNIDYDKHRRHNEVQGRGHKEPGCSNKECSHVRQVVFNTHAPIEHLARDAVMKKREHDKQPDIDLLWGGRGKMLGEA